LTTKVEVTRDSKPDTIFYVGNLIEYQGKGQEFVVLVTEVAADDSTFSGICLTPGHHYFMQHDDCYDQSAPYRQFVGTVTISGYD
jgi:hypothetical protein